MELPAPFLSRMESQLGDEYAAFYQSYKLPSMAGLRTNLLKINPAGLQRLLPFKLEPLPGCPEGFQLASDDQPGKHLYHAAGLYYLQDPSAMLVTVVLEPQLGERMLDLSAEPGGKATHIAVRMRNQGLLVANEIHTGRADG